MTTMAGGYALPSRQVPVNKGELNMPILIYLILVIVVAVVIFAYLLHRLRLDLVIQFRAKTIEEIERRNSRDRAFYRSRGEAPPDVSWRFRLFDSVTFDDMLYSFKPLTKEAYYGSEDAFLTPPKKTDRLR